MKRIFSLALTFICLMLLSSCEKAPFITMTGPRTFVFTRDGGSQSFTFTCNRAWSISTTDSWIQVSPESGAASDEEITVKITCLQNTTYDARSAVLTIKVEELSESVTVTQDTGIGLLVSPTFFDLTNAAQVLEIEVQKNVLYSVAIDNDCADWIKQGGTKALTTDKVSFTIAANTSFDNREGRIVFKQLDGDLTQTVVIHQSQTNGLFVTIPEYSLSNEAHTLSVEVKANVEFDVSSQAEWITIVETKALTPSTISLKVEANESYDNRMGTVLVKQTNGDLTGMITIIQKQTDFMSVAPISFNLGTEAQCVTIEVKNNVPYRVVIPDDAKGWICVQSDTQTKALTNDVVILAVAQNSTYDDREASITVKQTDGSLAGTVKINQAHKEGIIVGKTEYEVPQKGGIIEVEVESNVDYEVLPEADWIRQVETKALDNSTIVLSIEENSELSPRDGIVSFLQRDGDIKVSIVVKQAKRIPISSIALNRTAMALINGSSETLSATILPEDTTDDRTIIWISSNEDVATVDNGQVSAISKGGTSITAYVGDFSASCIVSVQDIPLGAVNLGVLMTREDGSQYYLFWAECNLGANSPEEYGDHYAWGETEPKDAYTWFTYKWQVGATEMYGPGVDDEGGSGPSYTKYCPSKHASCWAGAGDPDNLTVLEPEDDAAYVHLGNPWRMPTWAEWRALWDQCEWLWSSKSGIDGYTVRSKEIGNDNSIFLPAYKTWGYYWSSSLADADMAMTVMFQSSWCGLEPDRNNNCEWRYLGKAIRPVAE